MGGSVKTVVQAVAAPIQTVAKGVGDIGKGNVGKGLGEVGAGVVDSAKASVGITADNKPIGLLAARAAQQDIATNPVGSVATVLGAVQTGGASLLPTIGQDVAGIGASTIASLVGTGASPSQLAGGGGAAPSLPVGSAPMLPPSSPSISATSVLALGGAAVLTVLALKGRR